MNSRGNSYLACLKAQWMQTHYHRKAKVIGSSQMNNIDFSFVTYLFYLLPPCIVWYAAT